MGKRGGQKREKGGTSSSSRQLHTTLSLREQASGKKQSHNTKSLLKHKHLNNLANWTSSNSKDNPSLGSLGAFFGRRFAEFGESLGIPPDPALFPCQRCETILQPGSNCTVRIERNRAKCQRHSKTKTATQNNVVYTCHFCSYHNPKRGTPKGYMRDLAPAKASTFNPKSVNSTVEKNVSNIKTEKTNEVPRPAVSNPCPLTDSPTSLLVKSDVKLLDSKRRKRRKPELKGSTEEKLVSSAPADKEQASGTLKRRRKHWTTLKDIAESEEHNRNQRFKNFSIPFVL